MPFPAALAISAASAIKNAAFAVGSPRTNDALAMVTSKLPLTSTSGGDAFIACEPFDSNKRLPVSKPKVTPEKIPL
jgi:hypothetical protein